MLHLVGQLLIYVQQVADKMRSNSLHLQVLYNVMFISDVHCQCRITGRWARQTDFRIVPGNVLNQPC